jgi:hypothetical protein
MGRTVSNLNRARGVLNIEHKPAMKKICLLVLLLCVPWVSGSLQQTPASMPQDKPATEFPQDLLKGSDNFNLAIDIYGDSRGNFGPCG